MPRADGMDPTTDRCEKLGRTLVRLDASPAETCQIAPGTDDPRCMWIFTTSGFYSIVADQQMPGHAIVRARVRADLEAFCARTGAPDPIEAQDHDYLFRTSVPYATLAADLAAQAEAIGYPNFKNEVAARQGHDRAHRYGRIWSVMHELQEDCG